MGANGPSGVTSYDEEAEECVHVSDVRLYGPTARYCSPWALKPFLLCEYILILGSMSALLVLVRKEKSLFLEDSAVRSIIHCNLISRQ